MMIGTHTLTTYVIKAFHKGLNSILANLMLLGDSSMEERVDTRTKQGVPDSKRNRQKVMDRFRSEVERYSPIRRVARRSEQIRLYRAFRRFFKHGRLTSFNESRRRIKSLEYLESKVKAKVKWTLSLSSTN